MMPGHVSAARFLGGLRFFQHLDVRAKFICLAGIPSSSRAIRCRGEYEQVCNAYSGPKLIV